MESCLNVPNPNQSRLNDWPLLKGTQPVPPAQPNVTEVLLRSAAIFIRGRAGSSPRGGVTARRGFAAVPASPAPLLKLILDALRRAELCAAPGDPSVTA